MKTTFHGYYSPTIEEYKRLWKDGIVILDTNVLLDLYRLPTTARDELFNVFNVLKERLWIPHQVALEFQRRRLTVIHNERKSISEALTSVGDLATDIKKKVEALQIDKRGLGIDSKPLIEALESSKTQIIDAIRKSHESQLDISASDSVRDRLDNLFEGRIGTGPQNQEELDKLIIGGGDRYGEHIPPGFADVGKEKNPNEATFIFNHIKYQRKFGDLILWRQIIEHVKMSSVKEVLFVTSDKKEDWWWIEYGRSVGPHPELISEIRREGLVDLFWMYTSNQFIEHAIEYTAATVSADSVGEIKVIAQAGDIDAIDLTHYNDVKNSREISSEYNPRYLEGRQVDFQNAERCVGLWLHRYGDSVTVNLRGFPDFVVDNGIDVHGYEVKYLRNFRQMLFGPSIINAMLRGYMETREGRLSRFTLIMVISEAEFSDMAESERKVELEMRLKRLLSKYPIDAIVVGTIKDDIFEVIAHQKQSN